ncbi:MAG TPA: TGS domain-containing protein, partial [Candidatus Binatia bacterium]|nr:TGS domain-containing protein [Candidatus Binatia bacterium]
MDSIHVSFPEGKSVDVRPGTRIDELAAQAGVKKTAIAAKRDGRPVDLATVLTQDCAIEFVFPESRDGLEILRHSSAHLMAQAVQSLFPGTQVTIGPTVENGFYYDFKSERTFSPEDLGRIEERMHELAKADLPIVREE